MCIGKLVNAVRPKKAKGPETSGFEYLLVLSDAEGSKKQKFSDYGHARRAGFRHLLKEEGSQAGIITMHTPAKMRVNENGFLRMTLGKQVVRNITTLTRKEAEADRYQEVERSLRDATAYESKKPTPMVGMSGPTDAPTKGRTWQKGFSEYRAWDASRTSQGLPLQKSR